MRRFLRSAALWPLALVLATSGCRTQQLAVPTSDEVVAYYTYGGALSAEVNGNVAEITVAQSAGQIRRGGTLWAKVGPYIVLFTEETHQLFEDYPGLAGVRVITRVGADGPEVARALLHRAELSGVLWRRSLNIAGKARRDGTARMTLISDLVRWGEDHTDFEYNPRYTRR